MNDRNRKRVRRGESVRDFVLTLTPHFPEGSKGAEIIARIAQLVERVNAFAASSASNAGTLHAAVEAKGVARRELQDFVRTIDRTVRALAPDEPELREKFRLPSGTMSDQSLLSTARSFAAEVTPVKGRFVAFGMSPDFPEALGEKIAAFERHDSQHHTSRSARASDNAATAGALGELDFEIERLDAVMRNTFASDPGTLAAWNSARHVERVPRRRKQEGGGGAPPQPAQN